MTVEELMEALSRCDKYKRVVVLDGGTPREINRVRADSPASVGNPVEIVAGDFLLR